MSSVVHEESDRENEKTMMPSIVDTFTSLDDYGWFEYGNVDDDDGDGGNDDDDDDDENGLFDSKVRDKCI